MVTVFWRNPYLLENLYGRLYALLFPHEGIEQGLADEAGTTAYEYLGRNQRVCPFEGAEKILVIGVIEALDVL